MRGGRPAAVLVAALGLLLAGCADPGPQRPPRPLADVATLSPATAAATPTAWPAEAWWQAFGDPALDALIERALAAQPSLQAAAARAQAAAAQVATVAGAQQPQASLSGDATLQRFSERGLVPPALAGATRWNSTLQLGLRWELDLFGRQRAALDAAIGQQRAAEADAQAARVLLAADIAIQWFALARQLELQALAAQAQQQRRALRGLVQQRVTAGLDGATDLAQADTLVAQAQVELQALAEGVSRLRHALAELSGQAPQALATAAPALAPLRAPPLPGALGADLLGRRADLVAQRWRVEALLRDVDLARTRFYPDIDLVGFVGQNALGLEHLLSWGARTWGAGPALRLPVFDGGRLRAQLAARQAEADAAIEGWNAGLLRALRETADAVATLQALKAEQAAQQQAGAAAAALLSLARQRRQAGLGTALPVLQAEHALLLQRRAETDLKARLLAADVALTRALGGGFRAAELPARLGAAPLAQNPSPTRP